MDQMAARVRAIAMVHEQIYMTDKPSEVQLDIFLRKLMRASGRFADPARWRWPRRRSRADHGELDQAVPVALLATEAITNAIKHGTRGDGSPIAVTLHRDSGQVVLQVTNDGGPGDADGKAGLGRRS